MVKLIDFKENNICRGMVLRCKGKYPYEAIVDFQFVKRQIRELKRFN